MSYDIDEFGNKTFNEVDSDYEPNPQDFDSFCDINKDNLLTWFLEDNPELATSDFYDDPFDNIEFQTFCENEYQDECAKLQLAPNW